jgi:inorganic pyrophosphatase
MELRLGNCQNGWRKYEAATNEAGSETIANPSAASDETFMPSPLPADDWYRICTTCTVMKRKQVSEGQGPPGALNDRPSGVTLHVIVETPRGSRNKYAFNSANGVFVLRKVLPEGMGFPHDFGFIPSTVGEDGDPLDVLILLDEPTFPGCVVEVRLIGVLEGDKSIDGKTMSDHRFIAVANESRTHSAIKDIDDLNENLLDELERFFENYQQDPGHSFKVVARRGANEAMRLLTAARKHQKQRDIA